MAKEATRKGLPLRDLVREDLVSESGGSVALAALQFLVFPTLHDGSWNAREFGGDNVPHVSFEYDHIGRCERLPESSESRPRFLYVFGESKFSDKCTFPLSSLLLICSST
jgi:hypothetical protein